MARKFAEQFYASKVWHDTREYVLKRDCYLCRDCQTLPAEEVHHIVWLTPDNINDPKVSVNPANLISLCRGCHRLRHDKQTRTSPKAKPLCETTRIIFDDDGNIIPPGDMTK